MINISHAGAAALVSIALFQPLSADALYKRILPFNCTAIDTANSELKFDSAGVFQATASASQNPVVTCNYPTDPDLPHSSVSSISVNVVDVTTGAGSVFSIKACVMQTGNATITCGTAATNPTSVGDYTVNVSASAWTSNSTLYPYVRVTFPASTQAGSEFRGIKVQ